jgi:RNA polymerase sigma factor (sigma-70 family)
VGEDGVLFAFSALIENEDKKLDFEEIYYKYKDATFRRALKELNNNHYDAEEAFQIAWCKIARNIDGIETRNEQAISTYIMTKVEYSAKDVANKNNKWNRMSAELELDPEEYVSDDLVFNLCATERYNNIVKVIESMDKTYRDIMLMAFVYEMPIKKIAHNLNLKEKTVWTRFYRGKHILMELLKEKGFADEYCK